MAQRRASSAPPPNIAPVIVGVGFIGMLVAFYFGFPGVGVLLIALMFAGWSAVPPVFNGKKDAQGRPTPADDGEKRAMNTYRFWSDVKWRLLIPNSDWLPGLQSSRPRSWLEYLYPINYIWTIALSVGVLALGIPAHKPVELLNGSDSSEFLFRAINAFAAFSIIVVVSTSKRRNGTPDDPPPGVTVAESLKYLGTPKALPLFFSGAIISGIAAMGVLVFGDAQGLDDIISPLPLPVAAIAVFVLLYSTVLYLGTRTDALAHWRLVSAKRPEWESRWAPVLKSTDETPRLVDYEEVGFFEVSTFDASASMGYSGVLSMEAKIAPALGAGRQATILSCPDIDSQGQPMQGTINPRRFRVVTYPSDEIVDFSNPETDPKQIELGADIALMRVIVANGLGRPVFMDASPAFTIPEPEPEDEEDEEDEPDEAEPEAEDAPKRKWWQRKPKPAEPEDESESYTAAWVCHWAIPNGPPFEYLSDYAGDIGDEAGCEVVVDKRTGDIFFGSLTVDTTPWTNPKDAERVRNILDDNTWNRRWKNVFQGKSEFIPRREANLFSKMEVNGLPIMRQPFSMGQGVELRQYDKIEDRLAIALDSAPMVAITGFKAQGDREGARHPQGMCVVWSASAQIPSSPERLRPGSKAMANEWVLTWILNRAFDHTKRLARPEIISAKCLTAADSNGHIWEMKLRLYGGVTLEEVRSSSEKIRQSMGCQWIRVIEDTYGCTIAAGVKPSNPGVKLASARTADRISELNWEQAFAIANVSGHGGVLPKMVHRSAMEKNPKVAILDFLLPAGCEIENVKGAVGKLSPATDNAFIQVSPTEDPKIIRILASERNPLGKSYSPDWDEIEKSTGVPFSTGVDGSPVVFDPKDTAHLMLLGLSGSGKSVAVQVLLYGALRRQWHCVVINPVKGAGDYMFAEPFLDGACLELDDYFAPAAMMRTLYDEVARRMRLLGEYGVTKIDDLPEEVRPRRFFVILDEFTSLIEQEAVPARSDEIELERERERIIARNTAKRYVAQYTGKILREARAAGFSLMLATQKLTAKSLDPVPGGSDMKAQLSRILLGNASYSDKMSALRQPDKAPDLGAEVPPGRGIFEPSIGVGQIIQSWYAPVRELEERLIAALPPVTEKIDISRYLQPADEEKEVVEMPDEFAVFDSLDAGFPSFGDPESDDEEIVPVGAEVAFSLDDLDALSTDDGVVANDLGGFGGFSPEDSESQGEVEGEGSEEPAADDPDDEDWDEDADDFASFENFEPEIPALDQDLPVVVEEPLGSTEPVPVEREFSGNGSVLFLDVDGCIAPSAPVRGRTEERDVPGMGIVHVDHAATARIGALDTEVVWLTDWETDLANATFAADLGGSVEGAPRTRGEEYWWKVESIIRWIDEHPETESLVWVDDRLDSGEGVTVREQIIDILDILGIRFLGICPDSNVGLTDRDWAQIDAFLSGESEPEPESVEPDPVPVPEPERPVRQPETTRRRQVVSDEDDPFADLAAPRVVTGRLSNTGKVEGEP